MQRHIFHPAMVRKLGIPIGGEPMPHIPALPTEFEVQVRRLRLTPRAYIHSAELRRWCERNCNRCYIPEWLLETWGVVVDPNVSAT